MTKRDLTPSQRAAGTILTYLESVDWDKTTNLTIRDFVAGIIDQATAAPDLLAALKTAISQIIGMASFLKDSQPMVSSAAINLIADTLQPAIAKAEPKQ